MFFKTTTLLALAASATAHMVLKYPKPFRTTLNSSPLTPGDFPCKQGPGMYEFTEMNDWNAGETKHISFNGSAVHGGGSCQFSITVDTEPTVASQWKVIHSIEGGCPSNVTGNLPDDPSGHGAAVFPVTMPEIIPDGRYTFAWTWLNKQGDREFYMNCAPVQVGSSGTSAANAASALAALPDMFVANLPNTECQTQDSKDFKYPNPGSSLLTGDLAVLEGRVNGTGCAAQTLLGGGNGSGSGSGGYATSSQVQSSAAPVASSAPAVSSVATAPVASYAPVESAVSYKPDGVYAPGASAPVVSSIVGVPTTFAVITNTVGTVATTVVQVTQTVVDGSDGYATVAPSSVVASPIQSAVPYNPGGVHAPGASSAPAQPIATQQPTYETPDNTSDGGNETSGDCTPCAEDGAVVCISATQFGICNFGCAVARQVAPGMSCANGVVSGSQSKRHAKFPRAHLHRRHGSLFI